MRYRKASQSLISLIFFIIFLIIAAIAAGVVLITNNKMAETTTITAHNAAKESSTILDPVQLIGFNGTENQINYFLMTIKLNSASPPASLNLTYFGITLNNASADYTFSKEANCDNLTTLTPGGHYGIKYLKKGAHPLRGRITQGDIVLLCYMTPAPLYKSEDYKIHVVTVGGSRIIFDTQIPDMLFNEMTILYP